MVYILVMFTFTPPSLDPGLQSSIPNVRVSLLRAISSENVCLTCSTTGHPWKSGMWAARILPTITTILARRLTWSPVLGRITLAFISEQITSGLSVVSTSSLSRTANEEVILRTSFFLENP